jgi:transketolase
MARSPFSDYLRPSIRLAALMEVQMVYVHNSIDMGKDGPTPNELATAAGVTVRWTARTLSTDERRCSLERFRQSKE